MTLKIKKDRSATTRSTARRRQLNEAKREFSREEVADAIARPVPGKPGIRAIIASLYNTVTPDEE